MQTCPDCNRVSCACPPKPPADPNITTAPQTPTTKREARKLYEDAHQCFTCIHTQVCEVGRHTAELFVAGWQITISDCSQFFPYEDGETP